MRLSSHIASQYNISRRYAKKMIASGEVFADGVNVMKDIEVSVNVNYTLNVPVIDIDHDVNDYLISTYENAVFLYKPPFMHSQRNTPADPLCLDDVVEKNFHDFRMISRLDYQVDGVVTLIREGYDFHKIIKTYFAIVGGEFHEKIEYGWSIDANKRKKVKVSDDGNGNIMMMKKLKYNGAHSLIEITMNNAARHQVRAVCAFLGYPIVGDDLYGDITKSTLVPEGWQNRIYLHCCKVVLDDKVAYSPNHVEFSNLVRA